MVKLSLFAPVIPHYYLHTQNATSLMFNVSHLALKRHNVKILQSQNAVITFSICHFNALITTIWYCLKTTLASSSGILVL
jgi:hypothetical protein